MIIDRHNYEEFFLLYVDNELNATNRSLVEEFIQQNADLAEELEMLKQSVLPPEPILFEQKDRLYNEANGISLQNYEEYFLLSVDKELTEQKNKEVEKFVLKHPEVQSEFLLLEQTRLEPEAIVFVGKEKLYRKEGKERPVIFITWMRISAAAAILGLVAFTWIFIQNNPSTTAFNSVPTNYKPVQKITAETKTPANPQVTEEVTATKLKNQPLRNESSAIIKVLKSKQTKKRSDDLVVDIIKNKPVQVTPPDATRPTEYVLQNKKPPEDAIVSKTGNKNNLPPSNNIQMTGTFTNDHTTETDAPIATHAVYREVDNQEDEEEKSFYIGSAELNKNKLKGLFKKATSFFGTKDNKNDGEKTFKIAGFEIKSK